MDLFQYLQGEHRQLKDIFKRVLDERFDFDDGFKRLQSKLTQINEINQDIIYPNMLDHRSLRPLAVHALDEHRLIQELLDGLAQSTLSEEELRERTKLLTDFVTLHLRQEEKSIFPALEQELDENEISMLFEEVLDLHKVS